MDAPVKSASQCAKLIEHQTRFSYPTGASIMQEHKLISVDLAKNVFQLCAMSDRMKIVFNRQLKRKDLASFMAAQPPIEVVMEACYSSHYWGRRFEAMGHRVRLLPAQHVAPFVRGNKSDHNDALAIAEAAQRPNLLPVPIKTLEQSDIQSLHRMRERYVAHRTGLINQTRGLLSEYGIVAPQGHPAFTRLLHEASQPGHEGLSSCLKEQLSAIAGEYHYQRQRINDITRILTDIANRHPLCRILLSIPGIGPINATAIYSAIGNGSQFSNGREFAVWLGLTPKQSSSGDKMHTAGITRRGNPYLRKQLVHGARAVLSRSKTKSDRLSRWSQQLVARRGVAKASVALAARIARLSWVLLQKQEPYQARD
jgi:transposase